MLSVANISGTELHVTCTSVYRQRCLLSLHHFNVLMRMAIDGFGGGFRIGGRLVTNLRYANDRVSCQFWNRI